MAQQPVTLNHQPNVRSNPLFDRALRKHLESLQPEDRAAFSHATPEDVLEEAELCNKRHQTQSKVRRFALRFSNVVHPLQTFFCAVDSGVSSNPEIGGIVWGALRFVLQQVVQNFSSYFERMVEVLEQITRDLPFYQDYALELYRDSPRVQQALADVYNDILVTCITVRQIYLKGDKPRAGFRVALQALNPWDKKFEEVTAALQARRTILEAETKYADRVHAHEERAIQAQRENYREWADKRREFLALLPYEECHSKHDECRSVLSTDLAAGQWLLHRDEFLHWVMATDPASGLLWLRGKPGVGKTILSSIVIEALQSPKGKTTKARRGVAFFYCQHNDPKKRDPRILFGTLLHHAIRQVPPGPLASLAVDDLLSVTESLDELCGLLISISAEFETLFLVVDALDECDASSRRHILTLLKKVSVYAKVLITSRNEGDIARFLKDATSISIEASDVHKDIVNFVTRKVRPADDDDTDPAEEPLEVDNPTLRDEIAHALVNGADGMFLWVQMQISHLQRQSTDHDIRSALSTLPVGLDATFIRALQSIESLPTQRRARAKTLLRWVVCAEYPLCLTELVEAVAIDEMPPKSWDPSRCVNKPATLIDDCANLVFSTSAARGSQLATVQLVHSSVKDFLMQNPLLLEGTLPSYHLYPIVKAHASIVNSCIKYFGILFGSVELHGEDWTQTDLPEEVDTHPFLQYASEFWPVHLRYSEESGCQLVGELTAFLSPFSGSRTNWVKLYDRKRDTVISPDMPICHIAARLNLPHIVRELLTNDLYASDSRDDRGRSALHWATQFAEESTLQVLLESGADVNATDKDGQTPLHVAAGNWDGETTVRWLLAYGADVQVTDNDGRTPLHIAIRNGYGEMIAAALLEHGADVNAVDDSGGILLHGAASNPYGKGLLYLLLSYGADINQTDSRQRTALHAAAALWHYGNYGVEFLVSEGADVCATDKDGVTPLHLAAGNHAGGDSVAFLLGHGAQVNAGAGYMRKQTPLHAAAETLHGSGIAETLLRHGADVHALDGWGRTPLHVAVGFVNAAETVEVLLRHGADANALDDSGQTPLHELGRIGSDARIVGLLLQHGASVSSLDADEATSLHHAAGRSGTEDPRIVRALLAHGADVNALDANRQTPLHRAASDGYQHTIMEVLLAHGADVNAVDKRHRTAVFNVVEGGKHFWKGALQTLVKHGADVTIPDEKNRTINLSYVKETVAKALASI